MISPDTAATRDTSRKSRAAYVAQCAAGYFITLLVSDAYLAKLLSHLGLDDALIGVVSSISALSCLFGLAAIPLFRRRISAKKTVILFQTLSGFLFLFTFLLPFLQVPRAVTVLSVFLCVGGGQFLLQVTSSAYFAWANAHVDSQHRARFSAVKEIVSLIGGIAFTTGMGFLFDRMEAAGNLRGAFLTIAGVMLFLNGLSFLFLCLIGAKQTGGDPQNTRSIRRALGRLMKNRSFRNVLILNGLFTMGCYLTNGFLGTYKTADLGLSLGAVQLMNNAGDVLRLFLSIPFGTYSDRTSYARGYCLALTLAALSFLACGFASPSALWLMAVYTVLFRVSQAGISQNTLNMCYSYVPQEDLMNALVIRSALSGLLGFLSSLAGSRILTAVQSAGNTVLGLPMHGQQLLSLLSFALLMAALAFGRFVVEKQQIIRQ